MEIKQKIWYNLVSKFYVWYRPYDQGIVKTLKVRSDADIFIAAQ